MSTQLQKNKIASDIVFERILRFLHKIRRPAYLGEISLDIGYSLSQTEAFVMCLIDNGLIRKANSQEINVLDGRNDASIFALVGNPKIELAHLS